MSMRVTHNMMYNSFVSNMNSSLSRLMDYSYMDASQKKVNKPSDNPVSAGRILASRNTLEQIAMYEENMSTAQGWLGLADSVLGSGDGSVQTILSRMKTLALQGSTETATKENRLEISYELRQLYKQIINLANTEFNGSHLFAGHKIDQPAYVEALGVTVKDNGGDLSGTSFNVTGSTDRTVMLRAMSSGTALNAGWEYSTDGGANWTAAGAVANGAGCDIKAGGVNIFIADASKNVTQADTSLTDTSMSSTGTWMYVRPTAVYQGDDNTNQVVSPYRPATANPAFDTGVTADGNFTRDVALRIDDVVGGVLNYSYSLDNGNNWTKATAPVPAGAPMNLPVPGGYLNLPVLPAASDKDTQFIIHPHRADINFRIDNGDALTVNSVGMDIFGGLYNYPQDAVNYAVPTGSPNLFEVVGRLVAAAECNDPDAMGQFTDDIKDVMQLILTKAADYGGRQNRLSVTRSAMIMRTYAEEDNLSALEDVDTSTLSVKLAMSQTIYNSVLKSSSMIMQMSLVNFL